MSQIWGGGGEELDEWAVNNIPVESDVSHAESAGEDAGTRARWTCEDGGRGAVVLRAWPPVIHGEPARLVAVSIAPRLVPSEANPRVNAGAKGRAGKGHVLVVAAWDQMCPGGFEDELLGESHAGFDGAEIACRTVITSSRVAVDVSRSE